jgi:hypothetical protein
VSRSNKTSSARGTTSKPALIFIDLAFEFFRVATNALNLLQKH